MYAHSVPTRPQSPPNRQIILDRLEKAGFSKNFLILGIRIASLSPLRVQKQSGEEGSPFSVWTRSK
jgi:hypothetical protein